MIYNNNNNTRFIYLESLKIVIRAIYLNMVNHYFNYVTKIDKKTYMVTYYIENKLYKIVVKQKRGPNLINVILNEDDIDITDNVFPYLGPNYDFHGSKISPSFFNEKIIKFKLKDKDDLVYYENDCIKLNLF
jgi:hypothetical protein|tara:strand:+ start:4458 stop:4853 length:396 start_codon:yes stop_codon:yes gene_type:complete